MCKPQERASRINCSHSLGKLLHNAGMLDVSGAFGNIRQMHSIIQETNEKDEKRSLWPVCFLGCLRYNFKIK